MMAQRLKKKCIIVIEQPNELQLILQLAQQLKICPKIGIRARLSTAGSGRWRTSSGESAKFGLSIGQILTVVEQLKTRDKLNRQFRAKAPQAVKDREKAGLGTGASLVDEATARKLERSYLQAGTAYKVAAHGSYESSVRGMGEPESATEYGRGSSVDEAKKNLNNNLERLARKYRVVVDLKKVEYRVYRV